MTLRIQSQLLTIPRKLKGSKYANVKKEETINFDIIIDIQFSIAGKRGNVQKDIYKKSETVHLIR